MLSLDVLESALAQVDDAFSSVTRPERLERGTCLCDECLAHKRTLDAHSRDMLSMDAFGNPGWDPMTAANDEAFHYFLPGLLRLAGSDQRYMPQLLFHLCNPGRLRFLDRTQAASIAAALWALAQAYPAMLEPPELYRFDEAMRMLSVER